MSHRQGVSLLRAGFASSIIGFVSITLFLKWHHRSTELTDDDDESEKECNQVILNSKLPGHLKREIYKEKRRKASVRFLTMKKPMYDNIEMYDLEGDLLCTISQKKANWYVKKDLGKWNYKGNAIHLLFTPKGKSESDYNQAQKKNICVCCGEEKHHMRHYVVPYSYRTLFPERYKTHMPHDIVIMCPDCHSNCEQATQRRKKELENRLRKDPGTASKVIPSKELYHLRSCALALLNHRQRLPEKKVVEYERLVRNHSNLSDQDGMTPIILQGIIDLETNIPNVNYVSGAELVVDDLKNDEENIAAFIRDWRAHFLDTTQPRYLPIAWSVDSPVHCDSPARRLSGVQTKGQFLPSVNI